MALKNILPLHKKNTSSSPHKPKTIPKNAAPPGHPTRSGFMPNRWRNELVAAAAEFAGTFMFLFFAFGGTSVANTAATYSNRNTSGQDNNSITQAPDTSVLLYISLIFGFSLMVNVWVFFRVSGGLFNPAVTLGLFLIGAIPAVRACLCFLSQMLAGIAAAGVIQVIIPGPLNVSTSLGVGVSPARGVFLEMFLTSLLVFTIFMLAAEKHKATYLAPIGIGMALFVAEMVGVFFTGGSLNPARSFGPCVVTHNFPGYHYIYWFGPLMGTLLAFGMYRIVKLVEYQTVNPGQDFDDHEAALFKPPEDPETASQVERPNVAAHAMADAMQLANRTNSGFRDVQQNSYGIDERLDSPDSEKDKSTTSRSPGQEQELLEKSGHAEAANGKHDC